MTTQLKIHSAENQFYPSPHVYENGQMTLIYHSWGDFDVSEIIDKFLLCEPQSKKMKTFLKALNRKLFRKNVEGFESPLLFEFVCIWKMEKVVRWIATPGIQLECKRGENAFLIHSSSLLFAGGSGAALPYQALGSSSELEIHSGLWPVEIQDELTMSSGLQSRICPFDLDQTSPFWLARIPSNPDTESDHTWGILDVAR